MEEGLPFHDQKTPQKSVSEERKDQKEGNGVNPTSSIEHGNSFNDDTFRSLENRVFQVMRHRYNIIELGPWARDSSSFFNETNRSLEGTNNFIRSNIDCDLVEKNRGENCTRNFNKENQLVNGGEVQSDHHGNPTDCSHKDEIQGFDMRIHDVDMPNAIEDVSPGKSSNKKETLEAVLGNENNGANPRDNPSYPSLKTNTCGEGGPSLSQCPAQDKEHETSGKFYHKIDDQNDHCCGICGGEGNLVCCAVCPSTFHQSCLGIKTFPSAKWYCMYCRCKFCELYGEKQEDNLEGSSKPMTCRVCDQKYHQSCVEASGDNIVHSGDELLCGNGCKVIFERLEKLVGVKLEMEDGYSCSFIYRKNVDSNASQSKPNMVDCNAKLDGALSVMSEAFKRYIDTGIDIIHSMVYNCGSNFPRLDHKRFITAILEKDDEIISVATIRIHGNQLAEMPYVSTLSSYRRQGMFKRLLHGIESVLSFLKVELLVVPALVRLKGTWIGFFGFEPLSLRNKEMIKGLNLTVFNGTVVLEKEIPKLNFPDDEFFIPTRVKSNLRRSKRKVKRKQIYTD